MNNLVSLCGATHAHSLPNIDTLYFALRGGEGIAFLKQCCDGPIKHLEG